MDQAKLFRLAVEDGVLTFSHVPGRGWQMSVRLRRGQETWAESDAEHYEGLTTVELLSLISTVLDHAL